METQFPPTPPPPPPPPPRQRKTGLIIGLVVGAVLLLCLCVAVILGVLAFRGQIPGLSSLFATPIPPGTPYSSPSLGIRLVHPSGWAVYDDGSSILQLGSTQAAIDSPALLPAEAYAVILRDNLINNELYAGVNISSTASMMDLLVGESATNLVDPVQLDRQRGLTIGGYPAETATYSFLGDSFRQVNYVAVILSGDVPTTIFFTTSEELWQSYRPLCESILNSISFDN